MPVVSHPILLLLAPVAGLAAWWLAARARPGRRLAGAAAALSAALIVVVLAGLHVGEGSGLRVFVVDVSASTRGRTEAILSVLRPSLKRLRLTDRVAVVAFGREAHVLLPPTPVAELPAALPHPAGVDQSGTSFEAALSTAASLFRDGETGDIVVVTDGVETRGDATALAASMAGTGRPVHSLTLRPAPEPDAWVEAVRAASPVPSGRPIEFEVLLGATAPVHGKLVLLVNGREMARPEPVDVLSRRLVLAKRLAAASPGLYTLTARLLWADDRTSENNEASAAVRVTGKLNVTCVARGESLVAPLLSSVVVRQVGPQALGTGNDELLKSDVIVLEDISARELGPDRLAWLRRFVADAGRGLVVFGGKNSFGPGGYAKTPLAGLLPVDSDPERRAARPTSMAIVADRSGSMAESIGGRQKIEFVREAVLRAGSEFGAKASDRADELSVVAFSQSPETLLERRHVATSEGASALRRAVARMFPSGRTNIGPALDAARAILGRSKLKRHIMLVSDGKSQDPIDGARLARQLRSAKVVLSVLATGKTTNPGLAALKKVADATQGRFVMIESIAELPGAMARETQTIAGSLVREDGSFRVERGAGSWSEDLTVPPISGYVLTGARREAPPILLTGGDPILAMWRRGLGRVAACTTSLEAWAADWRRVAPKLFGDLVAWAGGKDGPQRVAVQLVQDGRWLRVTAEAATPLDAKGLSCSVFPPQGEPLRLTMRQVGRLRYTGAAEVDGRGTFLARVMDATSRKVVGEGHCTVGYDAEWKAGGDTSAARRISHVTSGEVLRTLAELPPLEPPMSGPGAQRDLAWLVLLASAAVFVASSLP